MAAKARGVRILVESRDAALSARQDLRGKARRGRHEARHVAAACATSAINNVLWSALQQGFIDTVGTDHCPFDTSQKLMGKDAFTQIPNGIPGIEERVNLLYTYGVKHGTLDSPSLRRCGQHARRETVRPVPSQGNDRRRQRCGPGDLRSRISRNDFRVHATRQQRLQRLRRHGRSRAGLRSSRCAARFR